MVVLNTSRLWRADIVKVLIQRELKRYKVDVKAIEQPQYSRSGVSLHHAAASQHHLWHDEEQAPVHRPAPR